MDGKLNARSRDGLCNCTGPVLLSEGPIAGHMGTAAGGGTALTLAARPAHSSTSTRP